MATATKESPADIKKATIDAMLNTKISGQPLIDLAFLQPEEYMERIERRLTALNKAIDAQIRQQGRTSCLQEQKRVITEIMKRLDEKDLNSEDLRTLLLKLKIECKE
ncbi:hypothetical protein KY310_03295 [Candidatus Woesearchaeota archaeon]|nr:hypothetical protein [Candidatus Woesearchaeota archaeon]